LIEEFEAEDAKRSEYANWAMSKIIEIEKDLILSTVNGKTDKFFKKKKKISLNDRP
jgi:hypothetical protein